jgi:hypothetical protein
MIAILVIVVVAGLWLLLTKRRAATASAEREAVAKKQFYDAVYDPQNRKSSREAEDK